MIEKKILLHLEGVEGDSRITKGWMSTSLLGGRPDPFVVSLFGTHVLPTPFLEGTNEETMLESIRHFNPDAVVEINDEAEAQSAQEQLDSWSYLQGR